MMAGRLSQSGIHQEDICVCEADGSGQKVVLGPRRRLVHAVVFKAICSFPPLRKILTTLSQHATHQYRTRHKRRRSRRRPHDSRGIEQENANEESTSSNSSSDPPGYILCAVLGRATSFSTASGSGQPCLFCCCFRTRAPALFVSTVLRATPLGSPLWKLREDMPSRHVEETLALNEVRLRLWFDGISIVVLET